MQIVKLHTLPVSSQKEWLEKIRLENRHFPVLNRMVDQMEDGSFLLRSRGFYEPYLLIEKDRLVSFCILAGQDDIPSDLSPWIGYVYTTPDYRGHHFAFELLEAVENELRDAGVEKVYISSGHRELYEKAGYKKIAKALSHSGRPTKIFEKNLKV